MSTISRASISRAAGAAKAQINMLVPPIPQPASHKERLRVPAASNAAPVAAQISLDARFNANVYIDTLPCLSQSAKKLHDQVHCTFCSVQSSGSRRPSTFDLEPDFHRHLELMNGPIDDTPAFFDDLKPVHVANRFRSFGHARLNRFRKADGRGSNQFHDLVGACHYLSL